MSMAALLRAIEGVVKALVPGSMLLLLAGLLLGVLLLVLGDRFARWGVWWLAALAACYYLLALPAVSMALIGVLQGSYAPIQTPEEARGARTVVLIGNGAVSFVSGDMAIHQTVRRTAYGVLEAARLYRLLNPTWIISSGGIPGPASQTLPESEIMRGELARLGIPPERVLLDSSSINTAEQVADVARVLRDRHLSGPVVFVTTPAHMKRVMFFARHAGLDAVPSVAAELRYDQALSGWQRWWPTMDAIRGSESAMYEYLALIDAWARTRGTKPT
jgi:uncharacterized SAM-binding protein YcdF (DUF218 family)